MCTEEHEYWKNRALVAEGAADKMGSVIGQFIPYVDHKGTLAFETYNRWLQWKDRRIESDRAMIQQSEKQPPGRAEGSEQ